MNAHQQRGAGSLGVRLLKVLLGAASIGWSTLSAVSAPDPGVASVNEHDAYHEYGYVTMKDGIRLAYAVWRPARAGRYATLLTYDTYYAGGMPFSMAQPYLDAGYAVVGANVRGTGCSEGTLDLFSPREGPDGAAVVEWIAAQPWSSGKVGMFGVSNGGVSQVEVAAQRPAHLKAIAPNIIPASPYRDLVMPGGMLHAASAASWTFDIQPNLARKGTDARITSGDTECTAILAQQPPNRFFYEVLAHPLLDSWWQDRSLENLAGRVTVPALLMETWQDQYDLPNGGLRVFQLLSSPHKRILLANGVHGGTRSTQETIRWMDHWLKDAKNGAENDSAVAVGWEQGGSGASGWTTTYPSWPVPNLARIPFFLTTDGKLSSERPGGAQLGVRSYVYPLGTELVGDDRQFALAPLPLGSLSYRSEPMAQDIAILGAPILTFYVSSERTDTDFLFTLKDIDPGGDTLFLQRAYLRASLRALDLQRSTANDVVQSYAHADPLVPGQVYEIKVSVGALGHVLRQGHRLELSILAPNPIAAPAMGSVPLGGVSVNRVFQSTQHPSALTLPILPGEQAHASPPVCGSLPNQPCRHPGAPPSEFVRSLQPGH